MKRILIAVLLGMLILSAGAMAEEKCLLSFEPSISFVGGDLGEPTFDIRIMDFVGAGVSVVDKKVEPEVNLKIGLLLLGAEWKSEEKHIGIMIGAQLEPLRLQIRYYTYDKQVKVGLAIPLVTK